MRLKLLFIQALIMALAFISNAQTGTIRGTIIEASTGEPLIGVTVLVKGTETGTVTDFDGNFDLTLSSGIYDLQVSYISFETLTITGITVKYGEVTFIDAIYLKESVEELEEVVVTAEVLRRSESALILLKRKSANLMDGISSASFRKIGDSDAAAAVKRVTGVSVEGGKYVYVRGLGDRYTKTMLNSVDIPGLDPDRNSLQMDIFPTSLMDNMMVTKTFVAELQADFTGGVVNIETKDFPEERLFDISLGIGYTPGMHFNKNYLTYEGGGKDFLGFDDGARELPDMARIEVIPSPISGHSNSEVNSFLRMFNPALGAKKQQNMMDFSFGLSLADQVGMGGTNKLGYIVSATYKRSTKFYDDVVYGEYQRWKDATLAELRYATIQNGSRGEEDILLGGLAGLTFKTMNSKLKLTFMHLQNGISTAGQFMIDNNGAAVGQSGYIASSDNLEYTQRGLTNVMLNGVHHIKDGDWKLDWRISPTFSKITDPDIRKTAFTITPLDTFFSAGAGGFPSRIWRYLDEINLVGKIDLTKDYTLVGEPAKLKFGASHVYKERDYEILSYDMQFFGPQPDFNGDPDNVLNDESLYPNGTVYFSSGNNNPNPNAYHSNVQNTGVYISNEFSPLPRLKAIIGIRGENYVQRHTGRDIDYANSGIGNNLDNDIVLDAFDLFPTASLIYALTDNQNLRFAYSRTIARPSFKELSFAQILDPITNRYFNGGLYTYSDWDGKLGSTRIQNYDMRWEMFMEQAQLISLSVFHKSFEDPIELVRIPEQQTGTEYQPRNVGDGQLYGTEIEIRKTLDFVSPSLSQFSFNTNVTVVKSQIDMTSTEYHSRKSYEKEGENIDNTREMAGQAPYIINAGFSYDNFDIGMEAGLFYNVKGKTLTIVGAGLFPDVYTNPFHSLIFNINKTIGKEKKASVNFNISNLLNDAYEEVYSAFQAEDQIFTRYSPKVAMSLGFKYSL